MRPYLSSLLSTLIYYIILNYMATPAGNVDHGAIRGSYVGLFFLGSAYVAIGIFASSFSSNQVVAFIIAVLLTFLFYTGFDFSSGLTPWQGVNFILAQTGINAHYTSLSRGVIDSRDAVFFISLTFLFVLLSKFILEKRKW